MSHENSETILSRGRFYNLDTSGKDKGRILGNKKGYRTMKEAVGSAKRRSKGYDWRPERHGDRPKYMKPRKTILEGE